MAKLPDFDAVFRINRAVPVKQPLLFSLNFTDFVEINTLSVNPASMEVWAMHVAAVREFGLSLPEKGKDPGLGDPGMTLTKEVDKSTAFWKLGDVWPKDKFTEEYSQEVGNLLTSMVEKATVHVSELVGAYQVGGLRERNVESYFKMAHAEMPVGKIMQVIDWLASMVPRIVEDKKFQAQIPKVNWLVYHTAAASTQQLVKKFIDETDDFNDYSQAVKEVVQKAYDAPWKKELIDAIPKKLVAHCYCYLSAAKQLPDNWYQGEKAINLLSTVERVRAIAVYKKLLDLKADTAAITGAQDNNALSAAGKVVFDL